MWWAEDCLSERNIIVCVKPSHWLNILDCTEYAPAVPPPYLCIALYRLLFKYEVQTISIWLQWPNVHVWVCECAFGEGVYLNLALAMYKSKNLPLHVVRLWYSSDSCIISSPTTHCQTIEIEYYCIGDESHKSTFKLRIRWLSWLPIFAVITLSTCVLCYVSLYTACSFIPRPVAVTGAGGYSPSFKVCNVKSATPSDTTDCGLNITHIELPRAEHTHTS